MIINILAYWEVVKIKNLICRIKNGGIEQAKLDKIHAPIGLEINSQTPEEIAVSIAAEIIKVKTKGICKLCEN